MKKKLRLPLDNLSPTAWQNLGLSILVTFYLTLIVFVLINNNFCKNLAFDYCAYWSAGKVIQNNEYINAYDLNLLSQFQRNIYPQANDLLIEFKPAEFLYLPAFLIPFQILSLVNLPISFTIWTFGNIIGFFIYLKFFIDKVIGKSNSSRIIIIILLSLPFFKNIWFGQTNVWLGIWIMQPFFCKFESEIPIVL